jgi:hypothetical protein
VFRGTQKRKVLFIGGSTGLEDQKEEIITGQRKIRRREWKKER